MSRSLPPNPSLEHLKKEAKALLSAQRAGDPAACERLRVLLRLSGNTDAEIQAAALTLVDAQMAVALDYGFDGWPDLKRQVEAMGGQSAAPASVGGSVCQRAVHFFTELQDGPTSLYQRSQMWSLLVALHALGREDVDYATLMAVSGWSGQFAYQPKPDTPSFLEPCPTVTGACQAVGVGVSEYRGDVAEEAWSFIRDAVAADQPVLGEHYEYGLFVDSADEPEPLVRYFVVPFIPDGAWWTRPDFETEHWSEPGDKRLFGIGGPSTAPDPRTVARATIAQTVRLATEDYWDGWRQDFAPHAVTGLTAIEQYAADIADPANTMQGQSGANEDSCFFDRGWCCYALYPQFTARECTGRYLDGAAEHFDGTAQTLLHQAASRYHQAFGHWRQWEKHLGRDSSFGPADERWANPDHRTQGSHAVLAALDEERHAIDLLQDALAAMP